MTNKYLLDIYENVKQKDKNEPEFLQAVYEVLNSIEPYVNEHPELDSQTKANLLAHYEKAKKAYDAKINRAYYTSKSFFRDTTFAAVKTGVMMSLRQVLGLVFSEIWFSVKDVI